MKPVAIVVSPNWRDYAQRYLDDCLDSLIHQDYQGELKYFFIDNESTAESYRLFRESIENKLPASAAREIIRIEHNAGFAESNNQAMQQALDQGFEYIVLLNMDTVAEPTAIRELVTAAGQDERIGAVQPLLMLWHEKHLINSLGNATHFLGFGYCEGYKESIRTLNKPDLDNKNIFYPSGAGVLLKASVLKNTGLFDEVFWMYAEDQDLGWRIWLAGSRCVLSSRAVVYHKYEFSRSVDKYYWMERNRLLAAAKNYKLATLLLILPALVLMEIGMLFFSVQNKTFLQKLRVYKYYLKGSTWRHILKSRRDLRKMRRVSDRNIASLLSSSIHYSEIDSPALSVANYLFTVYWRLARRLIIW